MQITKYFLTLFLLTIVLASCLPIVGVTHRVSLKDVSDNSEYQPHYKVGQIYAVKQDSTLTLAHNSPQIKKALNVSPKTGIKGIDIDFLKMRIKRSDEWFVTLLEDKPDPKGRIQKGTRIEVVQLIKLTYRVYGKNTDSMFQPIGKIIDGPYTGVKVVLEGVSSTQIDGDVMHDAPKSQFLELIE